MPAFAFCISDYPEQPDIAVGFVRAASLTDAHRLVADRRPNVFPLPDDFRWPADAEGMDVYCVDEVTIRELNSLSVPEG